ncbi:uncharacterized protein A1O9_06123 [Exophiala aquamarina CBS 119918]|uniref:DUF6604 domain-containing protein n=1 Tax=Exophiala aquamarina CBS 119918 TaxID=1182545 RepID=A0A072PEK4_9EURO|nr:uncharacterized protein A1O9_06123 [Exophiala aquamarina CBS 119918]KEF58197.1 hypothetical protein A1O9_06123 [Exophiala aquamarina CBS 119918]
MLLNPSHKVTFSGLPPDVLDAYVRYKKGTRALVAWFIQYSPSPHRRVKSLPIKELASLAQTVADSTKSLPDIIHFHFRETIAARKRLSKHFRGNVDDCHEDVDTINHEHFTSSLAQIYADLCACCGKPNHQGKPNKAARKSALSMGEVSNHYNNLLIEDIEENEPKESFTSSECSECAAAAPSSCGSTGLEINFEGDELGEALEITAAVQRAQEISNSVEECWELAGEGRISTTTAAFVTNVAFAQVRQVGAELLEYDEKMTVSGLHRMCCSFDRQSGQATKHSLLNQLQETEKILDHYRAGHRPSPIRSCPSCVQKPTEYVQSPEVEEGKTQSNFVTAIVDNIIHLVTEKVALTSIVRNGTPVYADVGYLVTNISHSNQSWSAVIGLHLLSQGYKTYIHSAPQPKLVSICRIKALRLAQQAQSQVSAILNDKSCFPCRCSQTLAYHLQNLNGDLTNFVKHKCWDLYFQSPWVAGNHSLEILDLCHYYGMRLFSYRHYVGAVLHSYNVLKELAGMAPISILESLSDQFREVFYPGGNCPKSSFRACWGRYVGARVKFKKGHKSRNSRDSWCMAIPPHAARRAAGLGTKSDVSQQKGACMLIKLKQQDYHVSDEDWKVVDLTLKPTYKESAKRQLRGVTLTTESRDAQGQLLDLARALEPSLTQSNENALPVARLNLLAVFQSCVRVVTRLSDETHTGADEKGINCICFASVILTGADRIVDGRRLGRVEAWKKDERECIDQASKAIRDVFGDLKPDEWLWDI